MPRSIRNAKKTPKRRSLDPQFSVLIQRCRDVSCIVYACFIDYAKAFDRCQHQKMNSDLQRVGIDDENKYVNNLRYADYTVLLPTNLGHLQLLLERVSTANEVPNTVKPRKLLRIL